MDRRCSIEKNRLHEELINHSDFPQDEKVHEKCRKEINEIESKLENLEIVLRT